MRNFALLAIVVYFVISILAAIQPEWFEYIQIVPGRDKRFHFLGAGLLSFFMVTGISSVVVCNRNFGSFSILGVVALLITLEEFGQLAIPSRIFDLADLGWSYGGIVAFGLPAIWFKRLRGTAT